MSVFEYAFFFAFFPEYTWGFKNVNKKNVFGGGGGDGVVFLGPENPQKGHFFGKENGKFHSLSLF